MATKTTDNNRSENFSEGKWIMSSHHRNIAVHQSQWCDRHSIEQNAILGLSDPVCQNGTISIYVPSDIVADLNA